MKNKTNEFWGTKLYNELNNIYFYGELEPIEIAIEDFTQWPGFEQCWGYEENGTKIGINKEAYFWDVISIMLHEMVHVWQSQKLANIKGIKDHGIEFITKAKEIEAESGLSIIEIGA